MPGDGALLAGPSSWAGGADFFVTIVSLSSIGEAKGESSALCAPFELRTDPISVLSLSFPRGELGDSEGGGVDPDFQRLRAFFISSMLLEYFSNEWWSTLIPEMSDLRPTDVPYGVKKPEVR